MKYHLPAGTAAEEPYGLVVTPESAGWTYSSLRVLDLPDGGAHEFATGAFETIVLPLAGSCAVDCEGERFELRGRDDVFSRVTDFAYVPRDARVTLQGRGRFALAGARCERRGPRYGPAEDVTVELRGAGAASRQVNNFGTPEVFPFAEKLIACEVLTPGGCWSSFPRTSTTRRRRTRPSWRRSTTSRSPGTAWPTSGSTVPRDARSTCWRRSAAVTPS